MNRTYELMFIVRPDMAEEDQDKLISTLETAVDFLGRAGEERGTHGQAPAGLHGPQDFTTASTCCSRSKAAAA